jgi:hypothetical protein
MAIVIGMVVSAFCLSPFSWQRAELGLLQDSKEFRHLGRVEEMRDR